MRMRQSTFTKECLRALQYSIEDPVYRSGIVRAVGTAYHKGLEEHYKDPVLPLFRLKQAAREELVGEIARAGEAMLWDEKFPTFNDAMTCVESMLDAYFDGGHPWDHSFEVLATELSFELPWVEGHTKGGQIDLVLGKDGWIIGVDHKSAGKAWPLNKEHPRKNHQACWYAGALRELFPDAVGVRYVFDVMTYAGKFQRLISDPTPEHIAAAEAKALQVLGLYNGMRNNGMELPANPGSNLCSERYCDFWSTCPYGSVLAH